MPRLNPDEMLLKILKFAIPIVFWLYLFRDLLGGITPLSSEPFAIYSILSFYVGQLKTGVIPLWQPLQLWGAPWQILLTYVGFANPIWLLFLLLASIGIKSYFAFLSTVIVYFLIGQIGFYRLAREVLDDEQAAYTAFLLLLFSSIGLVSFAQFNLVLIYVPAVWFFYFLIRFFRRSDRTSWLGIIFTLMAAAQAYLPFYFITILGLSIVIWVLIDFPRVKLCILRSGHFFQKNLLLVILTSGVLFLSFIPAGLAYRTTMTRDIVLPWRQSGEDILTKGAVLEYYRSMVGGGLSSRMSGEDFYSQFDLLLYNNDGFFFISGFGFLILMLGAFNPINRRIVFLTILSVGIFALSMGNASSVHEFLFGKIFYFKLMRNLQFFLPFLLSVVVLLIAEQSRLLMQWPERLKGKWRYGALALVLCVHAGCWLFLRYQENISNPTKLTVLLSLILCVTALLQLPKLVRYGQPVLLFACILFQPWTVLSGHNRLAGENPAPTILKAIREEGGQLKFSYVRGEGESLPSSSTHKEHMDHFYAGYLAVADLSPTPIAWQQCASTFWSYFVFENFAHLLPHPYFRHKFVVYDAVELTGEKDPDLTAIEAAIAGNANTAFVAGDPLTLKAELKDLVQGRPVRPSDHAQMVQAASAELEVRHFDANSLRVATNYKDVKFLVYNDSFSPGWQARLNGARVPLYRANLAFKGLRVPAGHNEIEFSYRPFGALWLPAGMMIIFSSFFMILLVSACTEARSRPAGMGDL